MTNGINYDYYYGNECEQFSFYRIPRVLFTDSTLKNISVDAKVLYGMMLDRTGLSAKNSWFDDNNRVYIVYTIEETMNELNCGNEKAIKLFRELSEIGLIERKKLGQGKPSRIYVKNFIKAVTPTSDRIENSDSEIGNADVQTSETGNMDFRDSGNRNCKNRENGFQRVGKSDCSYTNNNYTDSIYTNQSNQSYLVPEDYSLDDSPVEKYGNPVEKIDRIDKTDTYSEIIKKNLEYDISCQKYGKVKVDEIYELIHEAVCSPSDTIRVNKSNYSQEVVKSRLLKFDDEALEYVITTLKHNTKKVGNIRNYMLTTIFNAPATKDHYITAEVNHDMYGDGGGFYQPRFNFTV